MQDDLEVRPSFWVCGGGSHINCKYWDDINGCWHDMQYAFDCPFYNEFEEKRLEGMLHPGETV